MAGSVPVALRILVGQRISLWVGATSFLFGMSQAAVAFEMPAFIVESQARAAAAEACLARSTQAALTTMQSADKFKLALGVPACGGAAEAARPAQTAAAVVPPRGLTALPGDERASPMVRSVSLATPVVPTIKVSRDAAARAMSLAPQISRVAQLYRIDPLLLHAIAYVESRHNPRAVSHAGARGLMQVMPMTARRFGVTSPESALFDPNINLEASAAYLKTLQERFGNNLKLVIAAYNAGEGAVEKYGRNIPPYPETRQYVVNVLAHYRMLWDARAARVRVAQSQPASEL